MSSICDRFVRRAGAQHRTKRFGASYSCKLARSAITRSAALVATFEFESVDTARPTRV